MITVFNILAMLMFVYMLYHVYKCDTDINCLSDIAYDSHYRLFHICVTLMIGFLIPGLISVLDKNWYWLIALSSASLIGVTITPYKDSKLKYHIHLSLALLSMLSVFALWIIHGYWYIPILFCISSLRSKWLLGLEMGLLTVK